MSKSKPESNIDLPEEIGSLRRKLKRALSGGRDTLAEHRKKGAIVEKDMCFEMLKQHFEEDDKALNKVYKQYKSGKMLSGELKQLTGEKAEKFMKDFEKRLEKARKEVKKIKFLKS